MVTLIPRACPLCTAVEGYDLEGTAGCMPDPENPENPEFRQEDPENPENPEKAYFFQDKTLKKTII